MDKAGFKITSEQGFHITFANGVTVSVQFGEGNYCSNRYVPGEGFRECANADVVTWADEYINIYGGFLNIESGHASPDEVLEIMNRVARLSKDEIEKIIEKNRKMREDNENEI